jgi:hypothetical protein
MRDIKTIFPTESGVIAVMTALAMTALLGFVSLGTEGGIWYYTHRSLQAATDSAASGAVISALHGNPAGSSREAKTTTAQYGFADGVGGVTVTVNAPPLSGSLKGVAGAIEVVASKQQPLWFAKLFLSTLKISARSVAKSVHGGVYCVLALDPHASGAVALSNNAAMPDTVCGIADNSDSASALTLSNNATVNGPVNIHGGWTLSNNARLAGSPNVSHAPTMPDPYAGVVAGLPPSCTAQSGTASNNATVNLTPGHFCTGWNFLNNDTVNLAPGTYYIDSQLTIGNNGVLNGTGGVTLIIRGNYAIGISNNATINLTAPATGAYAGLALFGDRAGLSTVTQNFSNNTTLNVKGAIYFPNQILNFDNNAQTTPGTGCSQIIARIVLLSNNVRLENHCAGVGTTQMGSGDTAALVE